jgi:hypothetical protein
MKKLQKLAINKYGDSPRLREYKMFNEWKIWGSHSNVVQDSVHVARLNVVDICVPLNFGSPGRLSTYYIRILQTNSKN